MIIKNVSTGKYEIINSQYSYYFDIVFYKYNVNISSPSKQTHLLIQEKINHIYR